MRVVGYKWLCVEAPLEPHANVLLLSAFDAHEWTRGTNVASYAPSQDNLWGFNAFHGAFRARWSGRKFGMVMVGVTGFGTVSLYQRGWRAEKSEIVAVYLPRRLLRREGRNSREWLMRRLRATYDVPVFRSLRDLTRETERWGARARVLLHDEHTATA